MKRLTLEDCKKVKITDLWLGVAIFMATDEDAEAIEEQKNSPEEVEKANNMLLECYQKLTDEGMPAELANGAMSALNDLVNALPVECAIPMCLLKLGDHYYSLNTGDEDPEQALRIDHLEPLSDYYSENEYGFVEVEGKVCLEADSSEPFERYCAKVLAGYALF